VYDRKVVRRRRAALAVLVGLSLVLLTVYFGESAGGGLHAVQRGAQDALAPIETGVTKAVKPARDLIGWTGDVLDAKGENEDLKNEVSRLRNELAKAQTQQRDIAQLGSLANIVREDGFPQDTDPVTARVIARSPTVWYSSVQINKGSGDGIHVDDPVITGDGLAGKVTSVSSGTARVALITDASSAVSAQVMPDGANGIVKPEVGDPNDLLLDYIDKNRNVTEGTTVVTSGFKSSKLDSLFPRGIPIGKVTRVEPDELELYQRVHIKPFADLRRMDFVQVLTANPTGQTAQVGGP
jgi:rod shape-determining protein MreC